MMGDGDLAGQLIADKYDLVRGSAPMAKGGRQILDTLGGLTIEFVVD